MRRRRTTLVVSLALIAGMFPVLGARAATTASRPLVTFTLSGAQWSSEALASDLGGHGVVGQAHATSAQGVLAIAARLDNGDLGLYESDPDGTSNFTDLTSVAGAPAPAADPQVFLDPLGQPAVLYVTTHDRLDLVILAPPRTPRSSRVLGDPTPTTQPTTPFEILDLSVATHVAMTPGVPAVAVAGNQTVVFARSTKDHGVTLPLTWVTNLATPLVGTVTDVTTATDTPTLEADPVSLSGATNVFASTTTAGHVILFHQPVSGASPWESTDLTSLSSSPLSSGSLSLTANSAQVFLADLSNQGHLQLFSSSTTVLSQQRTTTPRVNPRVIGHVTNPAPSWTYVDVTSTLATIPAWSGSIFASATTTTLSITGAGAGVGDVYLLTSPIASPSWSALDVSQAAGSTSAASLGVTGIATSTGVQLFASTTGYLFPEGVGVYAIPFADWGRAIGDGWPIVAETGSLGTFTAPWTGFPTTGGVTQSSDFLMGQDVAAAHHRATWLSFWTVSGPLSNAQQTPAQYYSHGFLAGQWVAQQIVQYRLHGLAISPNWVILDPEGYPDNHSHLDAPAGASSATIATYATYWSAMLRGWSTGITDVDPSLHPGVYASQSEYRDYGLAESSLPVFEALAFGGGGPTRIAGSDGSNILGYIAFNASCTPTAILRAQEHTLTSAPWGGLFNTLQFNSGVYCTP